MSVKAAVILIAVVTLLGGCTPRTMMEKFADDAKEQLAREYLQRLADGDTAGIIAELAPSLRSEDTLAKIEAMVPIFPKEAPAIANLIGYHVKRAGGVRGYNLTYQFGYGEKWVLSNVAWNELSDSTRQIVGMSAYVLTEPLEKTHAFSFKRAGPKHYAFLAAAIIVPLFCFVTFAACLRTKPFRRKWLWALFVLSGVVTFSINWTTGQIGFAPISILLFGASAMTANIYSPWTLSFALPVGAILFWIKRTRLARTPLPPLPAESPSP